MSARSLALAHYRARRKLVKATARTARQLWGRADPHRLDATWPGLAARLLLAVAGAQQNAARQADGYLDEVLAAQDVDPRPAATVRPSALAGIASDGRPLESLLLQPVIAVKVAVSAGATTDRAMATGLATLDMITRTQVADAGRVADDLAMWSRVEAAGYVRVLTPPSCSRCVVLAGRFYEWNAGFKRHPSCDCAHLPSISEEASTPWLTRPRTYFDALSAEEQDRVFTAAGAAAIRLGADVAQVVNARKGARGLIPAGARLTAAEAELLRGGRDRGHVDTVDVFGHDLFVTTEGTTVRGLAGVRLGARDNGVRRAGQRYRSPRSPRLMPESILQIAGGDRTEAIRLLKRYGYLI